MRKILVAAFTVVTAAVPTCVQAQGFTVLHSFTTKTPNSPAKAMAQSRGGYLFTTTEDWNSILGSAIRLTLDGKMTVVHHFTGTKPITPRSGLVLGSDGRFYGATEGSGLYRDGTIFKMNPDGTLTTIHNFMDGADGTTPSEPLIESMAGDLVGSSRSKTTSLGTIFKVSKSGQFTVLRTSTDPNDFTEGPLFQADDLYFYGTSGNTGPGQNGSLFKINTSGTYKGVYKFKGPGGTHPSHGVIQASDGNFYGTAQDTTPGVYGVVFRVTPGGVYTVMHSFTQAQGTPSTLVQANDANIYGTTVGGGANNWGILYRIGLDGSFAKVYDFDSRAGTSGEGPPILQHTNGLLYSANQGGGALLGGTIWSYDLGLPPFVRYLPVYGRVGSTVEILGQGFTPSTQVSFNGVAAATTVVYPTYLKAIVPAGATAGYITVATPSGTLKSNKLFVVRP
jgi:uncharacterized repeat protein (TIGR03803 family)